MPIRSTRNLESYYDRFITSGAGGPEYVFSQLSMVGDRGLFMAGNYNGSYSVYIEYITIPSTGNGTDFGDLVSPLTGGYASATSDGTRAVSYTHLTLPTTPYV